jgi:TctA family transporter
MSPATMLTAAGLLVLFVLSRFMARYTVIYRRNNLAVAVGVLVSVLAFYLVGWWGLLAYAAGAMVGAWQWVAHVRRANERLRPARVPARMRRALETRPPRRAASMFAR